MGQGGRDGPRVFVELGIPGFEEEREIGRGGFSVVYLAWQPSYDRHVAIKVLSANPGPEEINRFSRECKAMGALDGHPNIVGVYGSGRLPNGQPYIVMEFLSEGSLADRISRKPLAWPDAVSIGIKLAGALESAHRAGVVHRDVKPANVMMSRFREPKLGDFGIARVEGGGETLSGALAASWAYAPPEVVDGRRPDALSDVYSLASTVFALIEGRPPFGGSSDDGRLALLSRVLREPVPRMRDEVPASVENVVRQGLAKDPRQRQRSAAELGRQLQAAQSEASLVVTPLSLLSTRWALPTTRRLRRLCLSCWFRSVHPTRSPPEPRRTAPDLQGLWSGGDCGWLSPP